MKVREVMTKETVFCRVDTPLSEVAESMWKRGCGFLPVVGEGGNVIGVLTDRDLSIAFGTRNRRPSELRAQDVMSKKLFTCTANDSIHTVLNTMRTERLRRLPVIDREGALAGVLSIDDLVLRTRKHALNKGISYEDIEDTYKAINGHAAAYSKKKCCCVTRKERSYA